jgi:hypothetical protein
MIDRRIPEVFWNSDLVLQNHHVAEFQEAQSDE